MSHKMNTEDLRQLRETIEEAAFSIPENELCRRFERLYTGAVNDVLREMCLTNVALPPEIMPLRDEMVVCGPAFTIRSNADPTLSGELERRVEMLDLLRPGHVCVWNANGDDKASHWGEVMTAASRQRGCRGAIVDGGIRDTKGILSQNFPIWCRYRTSNGSLSRAKMTGFQVPVMVGGVLIKPGDIIMADIDGVIVIPRKIAEQVLLRAEQIEKNEIEIKEWVDAGLSTAEVHNRGGYF